MSSHSLNSNGTEENNIWTVGLINCRANYLTAETFGHKTNANGTTLKRKQQWTLEPAGGVHTVSLRSHLGCYLAVDAFGNVTCHADRPEPAAAFVIEVADGGRWALRSVERGYLLGVGGDQLVCAAKHPSDAELWQVELVVRPQVNLYSLGRKQYARLADLTDEIHVDASVPWGETALLTLEFRDGSYAVHTCNNLYLQWEGRLQNRCSEDCLFFVEYHGGSLVFRDGQGRYLSPSGPKAMLKTRNETVTKEELFSLYSSPPQTCFCSVMNGRYVSVRLGVDVTANQEKAGETERFMLEYNASQDRWYVRTMNNKYWSQQPSGAIQASTAIRSPSTLFELLWHEDGTMSLRVDTGLGTTRCVATKKSGHLFANSDESDQAARFYMYLINRPILVLKSDWGFVGFKSSDSTKLECNRASYETIQLERGRRGQVYFRAQSGLYWAPDKEGVSASSAEPHPFYLELRAPSLLCIRDAQGGYLCAQKNGALRVQACGPGHATRWEF